MVLSRTSAAFESVMQTSKSVFSWQAYFGRRSARIRQARLVAPVSSDREWPIETGATSLACLAFSAQHPKPKTSIVRHQSWVRALWIGVQFFPSRGPSSIYAAEEGHLTGWMSTDQAWSPQASVRVAPLPDGWKA